MLNINKSDKLYFWQTPDDNNIIVLSKGTSHGFNGSIPLGGHKEPNSTVGAKAE
jgi:hypothetical protein